MHGFNVSDFDNWSFPSTYCPKKHLSDNNIDLLVIVWRRNYLYRQVRDGGELFYGIGTNTNTFDGLSHCIYTYSNDVVGCMRHEFAHGLLGNNSYHTGGAGAGKRNFLSNIGGYSILSSFNRNLYSCNGWDRWRLGWKNPDNQFYISARSATDRSEVETDLIYGESLTENEFILRDFLKYGDAIRIKLPYLQTLRPNAKNQYLWIENHQLLPGSIEEDDSKPKGIRFNIQIGNDQLDCTTSRANYFVPLSAFGNYDFHYYCNPDNVPSGAKAIDYYTAYTNSQSANPFTGYHLAMLPAIDTTPSDNIINNREYVNVLNVFFDGEETLSGHPVFGNPYDAFPIGRSLRLASNPPNTPLLTYYSSNRNSNTNNTPILAIDDNRHIFLNGLRVDIVEQYPNDEGSIKVRIRWDDFDIDQDVRWCDSIILTEQIILKKGHTLILDQGRTPVQPYSSMLFNSQPIFADPTVLTCLPGSLFKQESLSTVEVINNSTLVIEPGATYEIADGALLRIASSATLHLKQGSTLRISGKGHIEIDSGAYICIENEAHLILENKLSLINLHPEHIPNTRFSPSQSNCTATPLPQLPHTGYGNINILNTNNTYIQNCTLSQDSFFSGGTIHAGHQVTNQVPPGDVIIPNEAEIIFDASRGIYLQPGFEVKKGGTLETR